MSQGIVNAVSEVKWQYFVTLTFGTSFTMKRTPNKVNRLYAWLREIADHHRGSRSLRDWRFLIREELGEAGDRFHYHVLMTDLLPPNLSHCHAMAWLWREKMKVGFAVIRPYDPALDGVGYVLKGLSPKNVRHIRNSESNKDDRIRSVQGGTFSGHTSAKEANNYELGKYAKENTLLESDAALPSHCLMEWLQARVDRKAKRHSRHMQFVRGKRIKHTSRKSVA